MAKKNSGIKYIIYLVAIGIFFYYEYGLYVKYYQEKIIHNRIKEEKTEEIKRAFLLREENFYQDRGYERELKRLKEKELIEQNSLQTKEDKDE